MGTETELQDRFGQLLEQHRRIVFKVTNTYCWRPEDRADLAQEIRAQLWRAFPTYDPARSFSTWMYRVALNVAISFVRTTRHRERHTVPLEDEVHDIAREADDGAADERIRTLYRVINQLDELNRALLLLYLEEHTYREIADILGLSETNVATKISRLKQRLRTDIGNAS